MPVAVFLIEICVPATTAPEGSVAVPERVAPVTCAYATTPAIRLKNSVSNIAKLVVNFLDFLTPIRLSLMIPHGSSRARRHKTSDPTSALKTPQAWGYLNIHAERCQAVSCKTVTAL